jgi:excisionase family DNA binding protein
MHTIPEAAAMLGVKASTLRLQAKLGKFRAVKIGREWVVPSEEVERYRRENQREGGSQ